DKHNDPHWLGGQVIACGIRGGGARQRLAAGRDGRPGQDDANGNHAAHQARHQGRRQPCLPTSYA
ncbi:hypothetical protein, partial [Frankia sp. Cr1]|uniref:hypothetical protein n=1 Tax=Frankia sp. Cr1 TaxID=3073931 RepID=UPI002AD48046